MSGELIVLVTSPADGAFKIARPLVEEGLAACVNVIKGASSIFAWQGKICVEAEDLLVIKTGRQAWPALKERVVELHSYECPEIICLPIEDGYKPYLDWLNSALRQSE